MALSQYVHRPETVVFLTLAVRFPAVVLTTLAGVNPSGQHDAVRFERQASGIAQDILNGSFELSELLSPVWGHFLSVYWFLPGPSAFYGRLGNAILGALAIYNVYLLARYYHSHRAGVISVAPMIFFPSYNAVQSSLLRESLTLFCITTACRVLAIRDHTRRHSVAVLVAGVAIWVALRMRPANRIIYATALLAGVIVYLYEADVISRRFLGLSALVALPASVLAIPFVRRGIAYLNDIRLHRSGGRTVYLADVFPQTIPEFVAFTWVGAMYFLYTPFPWQVSGAMDLVVAIEALIGLGFTGFAVSGARHFARRDLPVAGAILVGFLVAIVLYGMGTVNYGTGMRHRQMFMWVLFLFGGIGIANRFRFTGIFEE